MKHGEDCVEEEFQLAREQFYRDDERGVEVLGMGNCIINI